LVLAYHYGRSDAHDKALLYLERAGDGAREQAAHVAAEGYYRDVLARLDGMGRLLDGARVREKLGAVLATSLHNAAALAVLEQAADTLRKAGEVESLSRVLARIANIHYSRGSAADLEAGVACLQPVLAPLKARGPSAALAVVYCSLARLRSTLGEAMETALRAVDAARAAGDNGQLAEAEWRHGSMLTRVGQVAAALPVLREAARLAEAAGLPGILSGVLCYLANIHEDRGELDLGRQYAGRALTIAERLADPSMITYATIRLAALAFFAGNWAEAHRTIESIESLPDRMVDLHAAPLLELGRLRLAVGAWEEAVRYLAECSAIIHHSGNLVIERVAQSYLAERDLWEGRPDLALARLIPLLDREGLEENAVTTYVLPMLAWAYLDLGDTEQAARVITDAVRRARAAQYRLTLVGALRVQALVALRQGDMHSAEHVLEAGLSLAQAIPYPHGEGRLLEVYGQLHRDRGERTAARERLETALTIFRRLGASKDVERTKQNLACFPL
jgi:tetratricopeptide (TPR) repeat protein